MLGDLPGITFPVSKTYDVGTLSRLAVTSVVRTPQFGRNHYAGLPFKSHTKERTMENKAAVSASPRSDRQDARTRSTGAKKRRTLPPVAGFSIGIFGIILAITVIASISEHVTTNLLLGFSVTMVFGSLLFWTGGRIPVLKDFGLPIVLCLIVPALLVYLDLFPRSLGEMMTAFYSDLGMIDFVVIAVIVGSIAGLPRQLLKRILARFIVPLVGVVLLVFLAVGLLGSLLGYGFVQTLLFIVAPAMAGGLPLGALPMSEMYAAQVGGDPSDFLSGMMSVVVLANTVCIILAAIINGIGKRVGTGFIGFNGEGQLMQVKDDMEEIQLQENITSASYAVLAKGLMLCGTILLAGLLLNTVAPILHQYAWVVLIMAALKMFNLLPKDVSEAAARWGDFVLSAFIPAFLTALSVAIIDIDEIIRSIGDVRFVVLVVSTVILATVISGFLGWLVKFNMIEASIAPGLIMADMGGSGDVAVLSAADRMQLMPFAAVATRFGGTLVLFISTLLVPLLTPAML